MENKEILFFFFGFPADFPLKFAENERRHRRITGGKGEVPQAEPLRGGSSPPPEDLVQSRRPQLLKLEKNRAGLICAQLTQYT